MNGVTDTTSSPVSKRSTSPRPPAVGEEVRKFHDTSQNFSEHYKNWNMECDLKTSYVTESADCSGTPAYTENINESSGCTIDDASNPSPPAPYKWAQSVQSLLEDPQGVTLFKKFLEQEGHDTRYLNFWFACRGVKKIDPSDRASSVKVIFEKKVKRISAISDETKEEIRQKLSSKTDVDDTIFDTAQREVETYMMKTTYPNFLRSDLYIQCVRGWQNEQSPEKERVVSPEPPDLLPTVHEDSELTLASNKIPLTKASALPRNKISSVSKFKPEGPAGYLRSPYSNYSSYHTKYGSYLPASAQDSELQSLSSDAQTDDTMSLTDSNMDFPMHSRSKQKRSQRASKHNAMILNNDKLHHGAFIPRTERIPEAAQMPQTPEEFVAILVKKLNKHIEDTKASEKMTEKLKSVENTDRLRLEGASFSNSRAPHKSNAPPVFESQFLSGPYEENDQDILDKHISRVFDSGQHTPASGCTSPPVARPSGDALDKSRVPLRGPGCCDSPGIRSAASHKHNQVSQFTVPNSMKYRRDHDAHSTDSAMFDYISDDNRPSNYRNQYSPVVGSAEPDYGRRTKEHSKRYASKKFSSMTDSGSSCVDSGISLACESVPSYSKVTHWLEAKRMSEQEREQYLWRNSSTSPVLSRSSSGRKPVGYSNCRGASIDVGCSQWSTTPLQLSQDPVPGYPALDTTSNLLEARRRLEDENRSKTKLKCTSGGRNTYDTSRMKFSKGYDSHEDGLCHRKPNRKSYSLNVVETATANTPCNDVTVIGYSYGHNTVPYLSKFQGKNITLRQFKSLLTKKGNFRYFFKTASNDFGTGVVLEEVTDDCKVLPLWEGKVFCQIEPIDDNSLM